MDNRPSDLPFLLNGGEMGRLARELDWSGTAVGPAESWPEALQCVVATVLNAKMPMFVIWGETYTCFYNDGYMPILARRHPQALGAPFRQVWPEIWGDILPLIERAWAGDAVMLHDLRLNMLRRGQPEVAYFTFSYSPVIQPDGSTGGMLCVCNETTEQIQAEERRQAAAEALALLNETLEQRIEQRTHELNQLHEQLRQSQKLEAIGNLTGGVAHDFNNVLQVISGNLQLMRQATRNDAYVHGRLNAAMAGVDRGAKLASQLLSFARRQPLDPVVLNSGRLIRDIDDMLRRTLGETVELKIVVAPHVWNTHADRNQLENSLLNLAINARDAMIRGPGQGGHLTIETSNATLDQDYASHHSEVQAGEYVLIAVSDSGSGMSQEVMARAFEPFFTTKPDGHGTGLGLPMVYGFVKQSGGHIKLYSEVGHGTTVKIYLPRSHAAEAAPAALISGPVVGGDETVLVVEDDAQVRDTVVALLVDLGYRVFKSPDAASALAVLESGVPVDLLFTDVVMPGPLRSAELARRALLLQPDIEVLFTSGYTENGIVHHGRLDQGVSLLSKPYRREDLARKIRHMFANRDHAKGLKAVAAQPSPPAHPHAGAGTPATRAPAGFTVLDILVVEDNAEALKLSVEILRQLGHRVTGVASAESALAAIRDNDFCLLITDVSLPGMSGLQLAREVAGISGIPVVFASGHPHSPEVAADALWLQKPFGLEQIDAVLAEIVRRREALA